MLKAARRPVISSVGTNKSWPARRVAQSSCGIVARPSAIGIIVLHQMRFREMVSGKLMRRARKPKATASIPSFRRPSSRIIRASNGNIQLSNTSGLLTRKGWNGAAKSLSFPMVMIRSGIRRKNQRLCVIGRPLAAWLTGNARFHCELNRQNSIRFCCSSKSIIANLIPKSKSKLMSTF